jgi:hypothetical protein
MEVHHPHHPTHKKKWSEYIIEFVMLFTAVTLGFFAENIREHIAENEKKRELMKIVALDLQRDLKQLEFHKQDYAIKYKACDSLLSMVDMNPKDINVHSYYVQLAANFGYWNFNSNEKSRNEADAKGYFRNSEDAELAYLMSKYNFFLIDYRTVEDEASRTRTKLEEQIPDLTEERYYQYLPTVEFDKVPNTLGIKPLSKEAIKKLKYSTYNFKHLNWAYAGDIDSLSLYATKAIELINKKYN